MQTDSVATLRDLYRASEARAARLRLLFEAGRDLALADPSGLDDVLAQSARRAALFAGYKEGEVIRGLHPGGIALRAPGSGGEQLGTLFMSGPIVEDGSGDPEDHKALELLAQLMATAIDRIRQETERETLLQVLRERERRLEQVVGSLFSAQEEERRRVAHELHDGVAQTASALFRQLEALEARQPELVTGGLVAAAKSLVSELRSVIAGLRPTILDDLGLVAAVGMLAEQLRTDGYSVSLVSVGPARWPPILESAFFRVAQEALSNITKHAGGPCDVDIRLEAASGAAPWRLRVRDHGAGPPSGTGLAGAAGPGKHIGLDVMRERMAALGGAFRFNAAPAGGAEVEAWVEGNGI